MPSFKYPSGRENKIEARGDEGIYTNYKSIYNYIFLFSFFFKGYNATFEI